MDTPITNARYHKGEEWRGVPSPQESYEFAADFERRLTQATESKDRISKRAEAIRCELVESERRLTIARTALESITHDMGASPQIHKLCAETLAATAPTP